jgi:hypothetical protein
MKYQAEFSPQAWVRDNAISVDPEGETTWDATEFVTMLDDPAWLTRTIEHGDRDDVLRTDSNAPAWIREWSGPFDTYLEIV